jgi:hypothetical protein
LSFTSTVSFGGDAAGTKTSTPVRKGRLESTGSGVLGSEAPFSLKSPTNTPFVVFETGLVAGVRTFRPRARRR